MVGGKNRARLRHGTTTETRGFVAPVSVISQTLPVSRLERSFVSETFLSRSADLHKGFLIFIGTFFPQGLGKAICSDFTIHIHFLQGVDLRVFAFFTARLCRQCRIQTAHAGKV